MLQNPGPPPNHKATEIGVYISMMQDQRQVSIYVQGHAPLVSTPLEAEALALCMAANVAQSLNIVTQLPH